MELFLAPDIHSEVCRINSKIGFSHVRLENIICFRSFGSKGKSIARIWSLPRIWQIALSQKPHYCLEVISEKFDRLPEKEKQKVLIHELLHIPKNFSGALLSHNCNGRKISKMVERYFSML